MCQRLTDNPLTFVHYRKVQLRCRLPQKFIGIKMNRYIEILEIAQSDLKHNRTQGEKIGFAIKQFDQIF